MRKLNFGEILRTGLRVFGYQLIFGFIGFMIIPAFIDASPALRIPLIGLVLLAAAVMFFVEGSYRGEKDITMTETLDKLAEKGTYKSTPLEEAKRFDWRKGILGALLGAAPLLLCAIYVALTTQPYAYSVQDVPSWLTAYTNRPEIGEAVAYAMKSAVGASLTDYLRIFVRFVLFPYIGLLGVMSDEMSLMFDRIAPLLSLIMPAMAGIGYLFGPRRRAKAVKEIEAAKNTPRKRLKKDRKKQAGPKEKKQLI